jgi:hypothetical protein
LDQAHRTGRKRPPRYRRSSKDVIDESDEFELEDGISRSKTMPSRMRGPSKDELLKPKELDELRQKADLKRLTDDHDAVSSADTEGDSASVSENRKKKSLLKKAKDRFLHAFHRSEREKENKRSPQSSPSKALKRTSKLQSTVEELKASGDLQRAGSTDSKNGSASSLHNVSDSKRRNSGGKAFLNSIRKSFSSKKRGRFCFMFLFVCCFFFSFKLTISFFFFFQFFLTHSQSPSIFCCLAHTILQYFV